MNTFLPGLKLSELFYKKAVRPVLNRHWPRLKHSAALIGYGSDVLGFDSHMSTDHEWGPRVRLFLTEADHARLAKAIRDAMANELPGVFMGYHTHFHRPEGGDVHLMWKAPDGPINHRVETFTVRSYFRGHHGIETDRTMTARDWLTASEQSLLELTRGGVFHDGLKQLRTLRSRFRYYPRDVWLYLLASQWARIAQEEPFVGRTGIDGDDIGSRIVAARLARDVMRLCFLMERQYAPYSKWFGTAFSKLKCAAIFAPVLRDALSATSWQKREEHLAAAYELAAAMHNSLKITKPMPTGRRQFHGRPFVVIDGERFACALRKVIRSKEVRSIGANIGSIDQFCDSTDLLDNQTLCARMQALYG